MKAICVEDDPAVLAETKAMCEKFPGLTEVKGFLSAEDALGWLNENRADAVLSDIRLPGMDGLAFAARIRQEYPETAVIFLTAHAEYAVEAFALHVSGYLLKPAETDPLYRELAYALQGRMGKSQSHISVTTFGNFDIRVDGKHISFPRSKAKELLAYLVDRQGSSITRPEAFALLWEEGFYDRAMQKQLDVIIRSLRQTLEKWKEAPGRGPAPLGGKGKGVGASNPAGSPASPSGGGGTTALAGGGVGGPHTLLSRAHS